MKYIYLFIYLSVYSMASLEDCNFSICNEIINGDFSVHYVNKNREILNSNDQEVNIGITVLQFNLDYNYKNWYFQATPVFFGYNTHDESKLKNINFYEYQDNSEFFFTSFYASYNFENWSIGIGILPFSNSSTSKFHDDYTRDGEGINLLNDNGLTAIYALYEEGGSRTIFGVGSIDSILPIGNYNEKTWRDDTLTGFIINTYNNNKYELISELVYTDMKYMGEDAVKIYLGGISLSWDDSEESGLSLYGAAGVSIFDNNSKELKETILKNHNIPEELLELYPSNFSFENKKYYGASILLGVRQDFDILNQEFFINGEWFHTFGDWVSCNFGNMYGGVIGTQMYNIRDDSYYLNLGYNINKDMQIRISYSYLEFNEIGKVGTLANTLPIEEYALGEQKKDMDIITFSFTYKF